MSSSSVFRILQERSIIAELWLRTALVSCGASFVAIFLAIPTALISLSAFQRTDRFIAGLVSAFVLIPSYVVAGAWSAGFGVQGWWTLSQVTAAKSPWMASASVIWIHGMAAFPIAYWMIRIGLFRCCAQSLTLAHLEGGYLRELSFGVYPQLKPVILATFLLLTAWTASDMTVTNLFQVTTLAEASYLSLLAGESKWECFIASGLFSIALGILGGSMIVRTFARLSRSSPETNFTRSPLRPADVVLLLVSIAIIAVTIFLPLVNIIVKAGWVAVQLPAGEISRDWSAMQMVKHSIEAPTLFSEEFRWSFVLSIWATVLALFIALTLVAIDNTINRSAGVRRTALSLLFFAALIACFALPGPLVALAVTSFFQLPVSFLRWMNDHTLAAPMLCLQFRLVPPTALIIGVAWTRWWARHGENIALDAALPWLARLRMKFSALLPSLLGATIVSLAIGFSDLSTYILCLPPGVTTVSMRVFDLLHYGVRSGEAGLLLVLIVIGACFGCSASLAIRKIG
jgi:iron(III) transport system permease protein